MARPKTNFPSLLGYFLVSPKLIPLPRCDPHPRYNPAMPMTPFLQRFPQLAARETRSLTVTGRNDLPDGDYGFIELYCNEPDCDCRRVTVVVLRPHTGWKYWATISYGWESLDFYQQWASAPTPLDPLEWQGPYLEPLAQKPSTHPYFWICSSSSCSPLTTCSVSRTITRCFGSRWRRKLAKRKGTERSPLGRRRSRRHGAKKGG